MASAPRRPAALAILTLFALLGTTPAGQGPPFSEWSAPVNLGPVVNSSFNDQAPAVSKNGRSLYFSSNRPSPPFCETAPCTSDIYVSQRDRIDRPWGPPVNLGAVINTPAVDWRPSLSRDEHWLFFSSNRPGSIPNAMGDPSFDIWASYREHVHDDFGWQPPINLGEGVNSGTAENNASYVANDDTGTPQLYVTSNRPGGPGSFDVYVSALLPDGTWGPAMLVSELSSPQPEPGISVRFDGLEAFLFKGTPPAFNLWVSTRNTVFHSWSLPVELGPVVNSAATDAAPHIAPDGRTLYFESSRQPGHGASDLWMTTRTLGRRP